MIEPFRYVILFRPKISLLMLNFFSRLILTVKKKKTSAYVTSKMLPAYDIRMYVVKSSPPLPYIWNTPQNVILYTFFPLFYFHTQIYYLRCSCSPRRPWRKALCCRLVHDRHRWQLSLWWLLKKIIQHSMYVIKHSFILAIFYSSTPKCVMTSHSECFFFL